MRTYQHRSPWRTAWHLVWRPMPHINTPAEALREEEKRQERAAHPRLASLYDFLDHTMALVAVSAGVPFLVWLTYALGKEDVPPGAILVVQVTLGIACCIFIGVVVQFLHGLIRGRQTAPQPDALPGESSPREGGFSAQALLTMAADIQTAGFWRICLAWLFPVSLILLTQLPAVLNDQHYEEVLRPLNSQWAYCAVIAFLLFFTAQKTARKTLANANRVIAKYGPSAEGPAGLTGVNHMNECEGDVPHY